MEEEAGAKVGKRASREWKMLFVMNDFSRNREALLKNSWISLFLLGHFL